MRTAHRRPGRICLVVAAALALVAGCTAGDDLTTSASTTAGPTEPLGTTAGTETSGAFVPGEPTMETFPLPDGSRPHDVWAATTGDAWYAGQARGVLGVLDPDSGEVEEIPLGDGSRPHGVIEGPDGAAWITDGGLNAIVEVEVGTGEVTTYPLPDSHPGANLSTATFDADGTLWFTGQSGVHGQLRAGASEVEAFDAPGGSGPYGITAADDAVYDASLAGSHVGNSLGVR